jgi:hypothetical protein
VPTIFFKDLGAMRLAGEETISTKFPRRQFRSRGARFPAIDLIGFACAIFGLDDVAEAQPWFPHVLEELL